MSFQHLWAGWRHGYVTSAGEPEPGGSSASPCVFCRIAGSGDPSPDNGVVWRGPRSLAVLNLYPYTAGHLLVLPVRHVAGMGEVGDGEGVELWSTLRAAAAAIDAAYGPDGINLGANLGRAAGAGIPDHLHFHALPRWAGDTNFMTSVAETRVHSQDLDAAWRALHAAWPAT